MIDSIKNYMENCPHLSGIEININYLGENAVSGCIGNVSSAPVIKTYTDGGSMRQYIFSVVLRQDYGDDVTENTASIKLLEQTGSWIEQQSNAGILPAIDDNRSSISLEIFKTGWLEDKTTSTASYQLQCRLVYYQE